MLHRKIAQLCNEQQPVCLFLRDQQRYIENATVTSFEGDVITIRYEVVEDEESSSWEETLLMESIGSISQKLATVSKLDFDITITEDCPEAEQISPNFPDSKNQD